MLYFSGTNSAINPADLMQGYRHIERMADKEVAA
jgi:hypothetical protein